MCTAVGVVVELPQVHKLVDRAGIGLEIADELLVLPALLKRRETEFLVEFHRLSHRADAERGGSQLIERHRKLLLTRIAAQRPTKVAHTPVGRQTSSISARAWLSFM